MPGIYGDNMLSSYSDNPGRHNSGDVMPKQATINTSLVPPKSGAMEPTRRRIAAQKLRKKKAEAEINVTRGRFEGMLT